MNIGGPDKVGIEPNGGQLTNMAGASSRHPLSVTHPPLNHGSLKSVALVIAIIIS